MLIGIAADDDWSAAPCWVVELLDRREKRVEINQQNRRARPRLQICLATVFHVCFSHYINVDSGALCALNGMVS